MSLTINQAHNLNVLMRYLVGQPHFNGDKLSLAEVKTACEELADAASSKLAAGVNGEFIREHWPRMCRVCGCTDHAACLTEDGPCSLVEEDLCSACVGKEASR